MKVGKLADIVLLFVAFVWGATFVIVQGALDFLEPHSFNAVRFFIAASFLWGWLLLFQRNELKMAKRKIWVSGVILGFWLFIGYAFQTIGLTFTTSSKAGFITGLSVVLVPLISFFFFKTKLSIQALIGIFCATSGLYLLTLSPSSDLNIGDALVLVCAIGFALQIIYTGKYTKSYPTLLLTCIQISTVSLFSFVGALIFEDYSVIFQIEVITNNEVIFALLITSIFATALAFLAQTYFQKFTSAIHTALIFAMEPAFAAITAYIILHETLSFNGYIGSALIFIGMILAELPAFTKKRPVINNEI